MHSFDLQRNKQSITDATTDLLGNFMTMAVKSRHCDGDSVRVRKDMEPHVIYGSNRTTTAALKKLEEEKCKLLKKNLILELELRQLEVQREKVLEKSHRWEEKLEEKNEANEEEKVCEERIRQLEADLNAMMETTQTMEAKRTQLKGSNAALLRIDDSLGLHIQRLEERKTAMCEKHQRRETVLIQMEEKTQALRDLCLSLRKSRRRRGFHFFKALQAGQTVMVEENERKKKVQSLFTWIRKRLNRKRKEKMKAAG